MIGDVCDISGKEAFVLVVDTSCDVRPPEKRLRKGSAVVETGFQFHDGGIGSEANAVRALKPVQRIVIGHPHRHAAVVAALDGDLNGHECRRAVVLRPVELHATREPRSRKPYKRGLDDGVTVEEVVVVVRLVLPDVNAPADFGEKDDARVVVFERDSIVLAHFRLVHHLIDERYGIDLPATSLIDALLEKHRVLLGRTDRIGL